MYLSELTVKRDFIFIIPCKRVSIRFDDKIYFTKKGWNTKRLRKIAIDEVSKYGIYDFGNPWALSAPHHFTSLLSSSKLFDRSLKKKMGWAKYFFR